MPPHPHPHSRAFRPRLRSHVIRQSPVYVYEEPICYCDGEPCICPPDIGALERQNPLPVGIYSVDLNNSQVPIFRNWQQGRSAVKVLKTNDDGEHTWILFSVSAPTLWATGIGFPEIAKATDEKPQAFEPTKDTLDQIADFLPSPAEFSFAAYMVAFIGVGTAAYLYRKELFGHVRESIRKRRASGSR